MNLKIGILGVATGLFGIFLAILRHFVSFSSGGLTVVFYLFMLLVAVSLVAGIMAMVGANSTAEIKKIGLASLLMGLSACIMYFMLEANIRVENKKSTGSWTGVWIHDQEADTKLLLSEDGFCTYTLRGSPALVAPFSVQNNAVEIFSPGMHLSWKIVEIKDSKMTIKIEDKDEHFHR